MQPSPFAIVWLIAYALLLQRQPSNTCLMPSYGNKDSLTVRIHLLEAALRLRCSEHVRTDLIRVNALLPSTYVSQLPWTLHNPFRSWSLLGFNLTSINKGRMASRGVLSFRSFPIKVISKIAQPPGFCLVSVPLGHFTTISIPLYSNLLLKLVSKCLVVYYLQSAYHVRSISKNEFLSRLTE